MAAVAQQDAADLIDRICDLRLGYLKALPTFDVFGMGWTRRVAAVRSEAKSFAT
jgi:lysozyme family protein